mgnify:CR=1 FL=1
MADAKQPPKLLRRWEGLDMGHQFLIAWPVLTVIIAVIHWTLLNQPAFRGGLYGLFWALPAAFVVAMASQNEARKRRKREAAADGDGDADA